MEFLVNFIVAVAAVWGAALSTYIFWQDRRRERDDLELEVSGRLVLDKDGEPAVGDYQLQISNVGHRDVHLVRASISVMEAEKTSRPLLYYPLHINGLDLKANLTGEASYVKFPYKLEPGDAVVLTSGNPGVWDVNASDVLIGRVVDGRGRTYQSIGFPVSP